MNIEVTALETWSYYASLGLFVLFAIVGFLLAVSV